MLTGGRVFVPFVFHACLVVFISCNTTGTEAERPASDIFGVWVLEAIRYDTGKVLKPGRDELYWVEFREELIEEEGGVHYRLNGGAACNWVQGWFDFTEDKDIDITFICSRLVCGIATQFCQGGSTSYKYSFNKGRLVLSFKYPTDMIIPNKGRLVFKPHIP